MPEQFPSDVSLGYSAKATTVVHSLTERLRKDGPDAKAEWRRQKAEMLHSEFSIRPSLRPFGSDRVRLDSGTGGQGNLSFRDPLNQERRLIPLPSRNSIPTANSSSARNLPDERPKIGADLRMRQTELDVGLEEVEFVPDVEAPSVERGAIQSRALDEKSHRVR